MKSIHPYDVYAKVTYANSVVSHTNEKIDGDPVVLIDGERYRVTTTVAYETDAIK